MPKSNLDLANQNPNNELHELLIRREQQAFDRLQNIVDNYDKLQKQLQDANSTIETTKAANLKLDSRQRLAIERLKILRQSFQRSE